MNCSFKEVEKRGIVDGFGVNKLDRDLANTTEQDAREQVYLVDTAHFETKGTSLNSGAIHVVPDHEDELQIAN